MLRPVAPVALRTIVGSLAVLALFPVAGHAQGFGDRLKKKAKEAAERATENRVDKKATEATDAALDKAENSVKCAASDKKCIDKAKREGKTVVTTDGTETSASSGASGASGARRGGTVNAGRDFTPGTRVLYATEFKRDELGDFPRAFKLVKGNFEVADLDGVRFLRGTSPGEVEVPLPETLPSMFTLEFDFQTTIGWRHEVHFMPYAQQEAHKHLILDIYSAGIQGSDGYDVSANYKGGNEGLHRVQVMADGDYVKVYVDGVRVANAPNANLGRSRAVRFKLQGTNDQPVFMGNLRIAAGGKDLYKALDESGRVTAEGIFFDTNSDRIRPESEPALTEIGDMLVKHEDLRLAIEGHTDNVGGTAKNQTLSEKRAAAVRQWLVTNKGVAAARLEARGYGASKPAGDNGTEDGRQKNRRVELVKL